MKTCLEVTNWLNYLYGGIDGIWLNDQRLDIWDMSLRDLRNLVCDSCIDLKFKKIATRSICPYCYWGMSPHNPTNHSPLSPGKVEMWFSLKITERELLRAIFQDDYTP